MEEVQHSIKVAARRCGLSTHVIRVWEKRYDAVSPDRTDTNRRLYSEQEIERLKLLRAATLSGHSIGNVARLATDQLKKLVMESDISPIPQAKTKSSAAHLLIESAVDAIRSLNAGDMEDIFGRAAVAHGYHGLLEKIIGPIAVKVGELWRDGEITAAHEHFASAVIRNYLIRNSKTYAVTSHTPTIVTATPAGQLHEIGAVMAAAVANDMGWRVIYLGTSLPAAEIAGAAIQNQARAVALSIVFPGDDPNLPGELENLRKHLPSETQIIIGGRAAESYIPVLERIGAIHARVLKDLYHFLERARLPS